MNYISLPETTERMIKSVMYDRNLIGQSEWEIRNLLYEVSTKLKPDRTVELGYYNGSNTCLLSTVTNEITIGVDIDGHYDVTIPIGNVKFVTGRTDNPKIIEEVQNLMEKKPIDLLFIDADHMYNSVKTDFEIWSKLVRPGGWVAFHDIDPEHITPNLCEVNRFWKEIVGDKTEFIIGEEHVKEGYKGGIHYGGIGLLKTQTNIK